VLRHRSLILPDMSEFPGPCAGECSGRRAFLRDAVVAAATLAGLTTMAAWTPLVAQSVQANGTIRYPIPVADSISIDGENEVILCRSKGEVFAFALSCPHQNTALRALPKNAGFQCPRHKSKYQPNGTFINGKATRNMDRMQISRDGADVVVDPNAIFESDTEPAKWGAALVKV